MTSLDGIRAELIRLCGSQRTRRVPRSPEVPCRWFPWETRDPNTDQPFTEAGAWEFVRNALMANHPIEVVELTKPAGKAGYVMHLPGGPGRPPIYVKLQIVSGFVYGRSFHISGLN